MRRYWDKVLDEWVWEEESEGCDGEGGCGEVEGGCELVGCEPVDCELVGREPVGCQPVGCQRVPEQMKSPESRNLVLLLSELSSQVN